MVPLRQGFRGQGRIRVERDPVFWTAIAAHPAVALQLRGADPAAIGALARRREFLPLAAEHGGFLVQRRDDLGFAWELHTLFTPEGWGREVVVAGIEALNLLFGSNACLISTFEVKDNARSRPWRGFGFAEAGGWARTPFGDLRLWILTRSAWAESRAAKRRAQCLH
jgi:hypothetical protein